MKNAKNGKVLFVSHKANRSGAPLLLLHIISHFCKLKIPFSIVLMEDGELAASFKKLGPTYLWPQRKRVNSHPVIAGGADLYNRILQVCRALYIIRRVRGASTVFYNTIVLGHMQHKLASPGTRSICYVHEMEAAIHMLTNHEGLKYTMHDTDLFLCVSAAVQRNLITTYGIPADKLALVNTPATQINLQKSQYAAVITAFKSKYLINDAPVIGVMGINEWRKGFDFFLPLVTLYFRLFPEAPTFFVWKGFRPEYYTSWFDMYDYHKSPYKSRIILLPFDEDSLSQMACFDVHLLLSREDPYPLVVLEAAAFGIPTVSFENAGGAAEFIENDCGIIVPYGDLWKMANELHALVSDRGRMSTLGDNGRRKLQARHEPEENLRHICRIIAGNQEEHKHILSLP